MPCEVSLPDISAKTAFGSLKGSILLSFTEERGDRQPAPLMGGSLGDVGEVPVTYVKRRKSWRMIRDVGEATKPRQSTTNSNIKEINLNFK